MQRFRQLFPHKTANLIGMIHVGPLPGTPLHDPSLHSVDSLIDSACKEAEIYSRLGLDSILVENMHDIPYVAGDEVGHEITATMSAICREVRKLFPKGKPVGVQVLASANEQAMAVALASKLQYIRAEAFVFGHVADEGMMNACAGQLLRYRKQLGLENKVAIFTDIKKKHSAHSITSDVDISDTAKAAEFFLSDGVILTGSSTGSPASKEELHHVRKTVGLPVLIGSGIDPENVADFRQANAFIVGSYFKEGGNWKNQIEEKRVQKLLEAVQQIRT